MDTCMDLVADALKTLGEDRAQNPLRRGMRLSNGKGLLGTMPGAMEAPPALGLKVVAVFPGNHGTKYDSHQGLVVLFDVDNGAPIAILDASEVTSIRTGAASGVATRLLAREDAGDLALLGSGVQAGSHLAAMRIARDVRRVRVYSPNRAHLEAFCKRESARHGLTVEPAASAREAVEGADLICTTTSAKEPVLCGEWIAAGAHVNAAGSSVRTARELNTAAVVRSRLFVDRRESTVNEAGDYRFPLEEGAITAAHIQGELGEILLGKIEGRKTRDEVTLFKSLGLAVEDLAAAHHVLERARERGLGVDVDIGGLVDGFA